MATEILIKHKDSGLIKTGIYGYSWTYLLFGWFVPLLRGEYGTAFLHLIFALFTFYIFQIIESFYYNKQYMTRKLTSGWVLSGSDSENKKAKAVLLIV